MAGIYENLKKLRTSQNLTQEEVAQKIGLTRQAISSYESGRTQPGVDLLMRFAEIYGVELEEILYGRRQEELAARRLKLAAGFLMLFWWLLHLLYGVNLAWLHITMYPPAEEEFMKYFAFMSRAENAMLVGLLVNLVGCLVLLIVDLVGKRCVSWKIKTGWFLVYTVGAAAIACLLSAIDPVNGIWNGLAPVVTGTSHAALFLGVDITIVSLRRKNRGNIWGR